MSQTNQQTLINLNTNNLIKILGPIKKKNRANSNHFEFKETSGNCL